MMWFSILEVELYHPVSTGCLKGPQLPHPYYFYFYIKLMHLLRLMLCFKFLAFRSCWYRVARAGHIAHVKRVILDVAVLLYSTPFFNGCAAQKDF